MDNQILGYINMAIGLSGIVLTVLSAPHLMSIAARLPAEKLGSKLGNISEGIKTFCGILVISTFVFLLALGMAMTLVPISKALGAVNPVSTSVLVVSCLFSGAVSLSLALYHNPLSVPGCIGTIGLTSVTYVTATETDTTAIGGLFAVFLILFLITGAGAVIAIGSATD